MTTKGHLFIRWEGQSGRFNVQATSRGLNRLEDDYYRQWPFTISRVEEHAEGYLKSLTPSEKLAVFFSIRGMCLGEQGRIPEAAQAFGIAVEFAPHVQGYRSMLGSLESTLGRRISDTAVNSQITKKNL